MLASLDIQRLRHVRKFVRDTNPSVTWDEFKGGVDAIGGLLSTSGLVHALLAGLRGKSDKNAQAMKRAVEALASWFQDSDCPVQTQVASALGHETVATVSDTTPEQKLAVAFIELNSVRDAMMIQAEAVRYLAQAKLLANAFKGAQQ